MLLTIEYALITTFFKYIFIYLMTHLDIKTNKQTQKNKQNKTKQKIVKMPPTFDTEFHQNFECHERGLVINCCDLISASV